MKELEKTNLLPETVTFETSKPKLTVANTAILKFIKNKLEDKTPIFREDITDLYVRTNWPICTKNNFFEEKYYCRVFNKHYHNKWNFEQYKDRYGIKSKALQWFKSNLGAVILKGRLVVLPIIEI